MSVLAKATVVLGADITALNRELSKAEKNVIAAGNRLSDIGTKLTTRVTLPIVAAGTFAFKEFAEQAEAMAKVRAQIQATGGVAGVSAEHIEKLGEELEDVTIFADDVTQSAAGMLLMFTNVRNVVGEGNEIFDRTVKLGQDLASVFGMDLSDAMVSVGKALEDPAEGLALLDRRTRAFDDRAEKLIKTLMEEGKVLEAQRFILDTLNKRIGGMSEQMAKTPIGQFKQMWNELGNAMEALGEVTAPIFSALIKHIKDASNWFQKLSPDVKRLVVVLGLAVAVFGPLLGALGQIIKLLPVMRTMFFGLTTPIGLAVTAILLLINAGILIKNNWNELRMAAVLWAQTVNDMFANAAIAALAFVEKVVRASDQVLVAVGAMVSGIPGMEGLTNLARKALNPIADVIAGLRAGVERNLEDMQASTGRTLANIQAEIDAAEKRGDAAANKRLRQEMEALRAGRDAKPPKWMEALNDLTTELNKELAIAIRLEALLGDQFDLVAEKAKLYEAAIQKAAEIKGLSMEHPTVKAWLEALRALQVEAGSLAIEMEVEKGLAAAGRMEKALGASFDHIQARIQIYEQAIQQAASLKGWSMNHPTIVAWVAALNQLQMEAAMLALNLGIEMKRISDAITKAKDPVKAFNEVLSRLQEDVATGAISWDEYVQRVQAAKDALDAAGEKAQSVGEAINQAIGNIASNAVDSFVDSIFGAGQSLGEFVKQALIDIAKLILKLELLNLLFPNAGPSGLGGLFGIGGKQHGGFIKEGEVSVVGEAGPELMTGGRGGVTIQPVSAMKMAMLKMLTSGDDFQSLAADVPLEGLQQGGFLREDVLTMISGAPASSYAKGHGVGGTVRKFAHGGFIEEGGTALVGEAGPELMTKGRGGVSVQPGSMMQLELLSLLTSSDVVSGFEGEPLKGLRNGGFLKDGGMAWVGEDGPELVSAGRGGVTVQPMHASDVPSSAGEGGITVPVQVNVSSIDSRDTMRFFKENEAVVAAAVTKAVQRSVALRRAMQR